jgi:ferredoxin
MAIVNFGYTDGSGDYYISIDSGKCDGCSKCIDACPQGIFELGEDEADPLRDELVARVKEVPRKNLRYVCAACKPYLTSLIGVKTEASVREMKNLPCVAACDKEAIAHSW